MNTKKKNVFIHIGLHKTGTTAIQSALKQLQDSGELRKIGFQAHTSNLQKIALGYILSPDKIDEVALRLNKEMRSYTKTEQEELQDNIILSCERFSVGFSGNDFFVSDIFAPFFHKVFQDYNVKIIVYLRRQDVYLESFHAHKIKYGVLSKKNFDEKEIQHSLYYKVFLDSYSKLFGKKNIIVRIYDRENLYMQDIVYDFFNTIGLETNLLSKIYTEDVNLSFSPNALRIRFYFDTQYSLSDSEKTKSLQYLEQKNKLKNYEQNDYNHIKLCTLMGSNYAHTSKYECLYKLFTLEKSGSFSNSGFMQPEERRTFLAQYEEDNAAVAREYLGREDGKLFNDKYPTNIISLEEPNVKDVITIFVPIVQNYHEKLKKAEYRLETLERRLDYIMNPWKMVLLIFRKLQKNIKNSKLFIL